MKKPRIPRYTPEQMRLAAMGRLHSAAWNQEGLDRPNIVHAMTQMHAALDAFTKGQGDMHHAQLLAMATNMAMALCEMGLGTGEDLAIATRARDALHDVAIRKQRTERWGMSGPELQAVREVLALRDAQLESEDNRKGMEIQAAKEIDKRIAQGNVVRVVEFA